MMRICDIVNSSAIAKILSIMHNIGNTCEKLEVNKHYYQFACVKETMFNAT